MPSRKPALIPPGTMVLVEWVDAHSHDGWVDSGDMKELRRLLTPHRCQSIGWVLEHTPYQIALIGCRGPDPARDRAGTDIGGLWVVPSPMLRRIKALAVAK